MRTFGAIDPHEEGQQRKASRLDGSFSGSFPVASWKQKKKNEQLGRSSKGHR